MAYIGQTLTEGTRRVYTYTATASQSTFDAVYNVGQVDVTQNGILLMPADYNSSSGTQISLNTPAALNDEIQIICHNTFSVADTVSSSQGGTFLGAITASNGLTVDDDGATPLTVDRATNDGTVIDVQKDGTSVGKLGIQSTGFYMDGETGHAGIRFAGNEVSPRNAGSDADNTVSLGESDKRFKDLYLGGGVYLGGTNSAHHLDDYEEGEFTYSIVGSSSGSWTNRTGYTKGSYVKIGNTVHIQLRFETTSRGSPSGTYVQITGFPFTNIATSAGGSNNQVQAAINVRGNGQSSDSCGTYGLINNNSAVMSLFIRRSNSSYSFDPIQPNDISGNTEGGLVFTYRTS